MRKYMNYFFCFFPIWHRLLMFSSAKILLFSEPNYAKSYLFVPNAILCQNIPICPHFYGEIFAQVNYYLYLCTQIQRVMENQNTNRGEIIIYRAEDNTVQLDVRMEQDTVWLTQQQMAELFQSSRTNIVEHIRHIYEDGELAEDATCRKFRQVQQEGIRMVAREMPFYNLDVIISVGYRVNSKRAVAFRQWSTKILKDYLIKGYAVNEKLRREQLSDLRQLVQIVGRTMQSKAVESADETQAIFDVVVDYTYALDTLDNYDYERLTVKETTPEQRFHATYENAMQTINALREKFGGSALFGNEKDDSFKSSIGQIYQTFGGQDLYPSVEEKAAMLLYLVTKNHSFSDGNKRIAATLFLWFLNNNGILYHEDGTKRIADNTLVALTLMIAESRTEEKDTMVKVVVNLINQKN